MDEPSVAFGSTSPIRTTTPVSTTTTPAVSTSTPVVGPTIPTPTTESSTRPVPPTPTDTNNQENHALSAYSRDGIIISVTLISTVLAIALYV